MNILTFNLIFSLLEGLIIRGHGKNAYIARKTFIMLIFIQLFILHAFVDPNSMVDLPGYVETYEDVADYPLLYSLTVGFVGVKMEPGWIVLCKVLSFLSTNSILILIVSSLIIVGGYCTIIKKYSIVPWLSVFLWLCTTFNQSLFVLRQHAAMAICILSIPFVLKRDWKKFWIIILLATSIHQTAVIFIPLYYIYDCNINKRFWYISGAIFVLAGLIAPTVFSWLFANTWYNSYEDAEGSNAVNFLIYLCVFALYLFTSNFKMRNIDGIEKFFVIMLMMSLLLSFVGIGFGPTNRLVKYYGISTIWLLPIALCKINDKTIRAVGCLVVCILYFLLYSSASGMEYIKDYKLIF